jgi:hypothetical protein
MPLLREGCGIGNIRGSASHYQHVGQFRGTLSGGTDPAIALKSYAYKGLHERRAEQAVGLQRRAEREDPAWLDVLQTESSQRRQPNRLACRL